MSLQYLIQVIELVTLFRLQALNVTSRCDDFYTTYVAIVLY